MGKTIICLGCPNGCHLECTTKEDGTVTVTDAQCEKGEAYGREELLEPKRTVTAVVRTNSAEVPYVPVKTDTPLVKPLIPQLIKDLYALEVRLPVATGQTLLEKVGGTEVKVVFTRTVAATHG